MAASDAPFASSSSTMIGSWAGPVVSAFIAFALRFMDGQAGARAAHDGNFPKVYGEMNKDRRHSKKRSILSRD